MQARKVARELDRLRHEMRKAQRVAESGSMMDEPSECTCEPGEWAERLDQCLLLLALPKRKARPKDPVRTARGATVKQLDDLCRAIVFARDGGKCQRCGREAGLRDWSHVITRGDAAIRWSLGNSLVLCRGCHKFWWHKHPIEAARWYDEKFGKGAYDNLKLTAKFNRKTSKLETLLFLEKEAQRYGITLPLSASTPSAP